MGMDDTHMKLRGAPVLDEPALSSNQKMIADKLTVSELMTVAMIALPPVVKVCGRHSPAHHLHAHSHAARQMPLATVGASRGPMWGGAATTLSCAVSCASGVLTPAEACRLCAGAAAGGNPAV